MITANGQHIIAPAPALFLDSRALNLFANESIRWDLGPILIRQLKVSRFEAAWLELRVYPLRTGGELMTLGLFCYN